MDAAARIFEYRTCQLHCCGFKTFYNMPSLLRLNPVNSPLSVLMRPASPLTRLSCRSLLRLKDSFWCSPHMTTCLHMSSKTQAGDHLQLPPVVLSKEGRERGLATSLLERLALARPASVALLSTQVLCSTLSSRLIMLDTTSIDPTQ